MDEQAQAIKDEEKLIDALARILILIAKAIASNNKNDNAKHKQLNKE